VGLIGRRHVEEIQRSSSAELAAIVDPVPAGAEPAREEGGAGRGRLPDSGHRPAGSLAIPTMRLQAAS
jgi:hypothetical protein